MTQSFNSPFTGELHPITDAPDEVFSEKMTGDGFLVYPTDSAVYAPCDSTVDLVFDTKHALGLRTADGLEYMLHIGIDTVELNGGFPTPACASLRIWTKNVKYGPSKAAPSGPWKRRSASDVPVTSH